MPQLEGKKRKDYAFQRQLSEKPSVITGLPRATASLRWAPYCAQLGFGQVFCNCMIKAVSTGNTLWVLKNQAAVCRAQASVS